MRIQISTGRCEHFLGWVNKPSHAGFVVARYIDGLWESTILFSDLRAASKV